MTRTTKYREKLNNRMFAKKVLLEGKTQQQAYKEMHPKANRQTCLKNASLYAKKPGVIAAIDEFLLKIEKKDIDKVLVGVLKDAKGAKKEVIYNSKGDVTEIKDNQMTLSSREQLLKIAGHPSFASGMKVNIDNRRVNITEELAEKLIEAISSLGRREIEECSQDGVERAESIDDAEYE